MTTPFADQLGQLKSRAFSEFNDVGDFIWKSPRFLIHETTLEKEKLKDYFPEGGETARLRWQHESAKLGSTFPYLIAIGNLFSATSLFETYLLLLVELLQETTTITIDKTKGQGFPRACTYLRTNFVRPESVSLFYQVEAAFRIRNCMAHASGLLSNVRDRREVRRVVKDGIYLSSDDRDRRRSMGGQFDELSIVPSKLGERLQVNNEYSYITVFYMRDHYLALCEALRNP